MAKLAAIVFARLDGTPPADLALDRLPDAATVFEQVKGTFGPFLEPGATATMVDADAAIAAAPGMRLIYVYGHAWLADGDVWTATPGVRGSQIENGRQLILRLFGSSDPTTTIVILDTCHAAAFERHLRSDQTPRLAVFGSSATESALALVGDRTSRLSAALAQGIGRTQGGVDLTITTIEAARALNRDGVIEGQTVSYSMHGAPVVLERSGPSERGSRTRTVARIRNLLLAGGAIVALAMISVGWFYRTHVLVDIDVHDLAAIASQIRVHATSETPAENGSAAFQDAVVTGSHTRFWAPAGDMILTIKRAIPRRLGARDQLPHRAGTRLLGHREVGFALDAVGGRRPATSRDGLHPAGALDQGSRQGAPRQPKPLLDRHTAADRGGVPPRRHAVGRRRTASSGERRPDSTGAAKFRRRRGRPRAATGIERRAWSGLRQDQRGRSAARNCPRRHRGRPRQRALPALPGPDDPSRGKTLLL